MAARAKTATRTRSCPECKSKRVAPIMYGYPGNMDEALKAAKEEKIGLGGCVIEEDAPTWQCFACGHSWGKLR